MRGRSDHQIRIGGVISSYLCAANRFFFLHNTACRPISLQTNCDSVIQWDSNIWRAIYIRRVLIFFFPYRDNRFFINFFFFFKCFDTFFITKLSFLHTETINHLYLIFENFLFQNDYQKSPWDCPRSINISISDVNKCQTIP